MSTPMDRVVVGRIGRAHGLHGHVIVHPETDNPERFVPGSVVHAGDRALEVATARPHETGLRVKFRSVDGRAAAEELGGSVLTIGEEERRSLGDDEFWPDDLVGLEVFDASGVRRGTVLDVVEGVAQDRLVVDAGDRTVEIPFVSELVPDVDIEHGRLSLGSIGGLFDDDLGG